ncbi:xylose isomerase-like isoform X2 [Agrilus planipennis]|uniref:Xylose isomerase n=1 Tax=Agrilus planipennis TaxID=224129 RepID=A0A1W4XIZ0_AGRPL|nr:xylose isomerase-like isoform X2 [Agrilus planipennis]
MYPQPAIKRPKTGREVKTEFLEFFPGIHRIEYKPDTPFSSENGLFYRYYNASERIHGRTMEDWLRPAIFLGKAFTPNLYSCIKPWNDNSQTLDNYKKGIRAMFELCIKLGVKYWAGYDGDLVPESENFDENQNNLEIIINFVQEYQQKTGIKPLWFGADLKNNSRYVNGAFTNSEASIVTYAGYQVKQALQIANKLGSECFMLSPFQENYGSLLNTDLTKEIKHFAKFIKTIYDQKEKIGYNGQMLMQTVPDEGETTGITQYCRDFFSCTSFLKQFNLDKYFKMNVKPGHEFHMAKLYGLLGSVDVKEKDLLDIKSGIYLLRTVVENGGMAPGGLTFYLPSHNAPFDPKDLIEGYISAIDNYAKSLRIAVKLVNDAQLNKSIQMRYLSFSSGWGARIDNSDISLDDCEEQIKKQEIHSFPQPISSHYEHCLMVVTRYTDTTLKNIFEIEKRD